jgi:hypothetical protein
MKAYPFLLPALLLSVASSRLYAQSPARQPIPTVSERMGGNEIASQVVKEIEFNGAPLSAVVADLKSKCPNFQPVIVADAGCERDPTLPDISLKNVPLGQILDLIERMRPDVTIEPVLTGKQVPNGAQGVVCIHINAVCNGAAGYGGAPPGVQVYSLRGLMGGVTLADVLSAVQAVLEASGSSEGSVLKVHEKTGTLIFKGSPAQIELVTRTLKTFEPTPAEIERSRRLEQTQIEGVRFNTEIERLKSRLNEAQNEAAEARAIMHKQAEEIETLQGRLRGHAEKPQ